MKLLTFTLFVLGLSLSSCMTLYANELGFPVSASTTYNSEHLNYRLWNTQRQGSAGAWAAGYQNTNQWIQVSSITPQFWAGVMTQGRADKDQWVTSYKVQYSDDGVNWQYVDNGEIFTGNTDRNTLQTSLFSTPVVARTLRIVPQTWYGYLSLRFDAIIQTTESPFWS
jgi:hypothetical protein